MAGTRYFNTGRDAGRIGAASEIMRIEILKKGKLPATERYKQILKKKMAANKEKAMGGVRVNVGFNIPSNLKEARKLSKQAEQKLKELAMRKAAKEAKRIRQMVIVTPRNYQNGSLDKKGKIYDIAGNVVGKVNTKNGKMSTMHGWNIGRYKPKSFMTDMAIQNAITQHSPYFIQQRKLQMLQAQGASQYGVHGAPMMSPVSDVEVISVHGSPQNNFNNFFGSDLAPQRQNVGMTSWGARSDNVWGNFADNAWGGFADNVWGGNNSDIWGGIGVPSGWGSSGPKIWGTGSGKNYIYKVTNAIAALFGLSTKQNRQRLQSLNSAASRNAGGAHEVSRSTRSAGAHESAPTRSAPSAPTGGRR
jgi:hypothetical protein